MLPGVWKVSSSQQPCLPAAVEPCLSLLLSSPLLFASLSLSPLSLSLSQMKLWPEEAK